MTLIWWHHQNMLFTVTKIDVGSYWHICHKANVQSTIVKRYLNNTVKLKQAISDKSLCIFPFFNVSVNSKHDHPPGHPRGFAHSSCPWGRVFAPLSCPGVCPGGGAFNQSKSSIILKKARFLLFLLNKWVALFICLYIYLFICLCMFTNG